MKSRLPLLLTAILSLVWSTVSAQTTAVKRSALDMLPASTTLLVRVRSCSDFTKKFKESPLYALREEPSMKLFIDRLGKEMDDEVKKLREELGFDLMDMVSKVEGEVAFAVGDLDKVISAVARSQAQVGGPPDVKPGDLPILVSFDAGSSAETMKGYLEKAFDAAAREGAARDDEDFQGGTITTITNTKKKTEDDIERLFVGRHGSSFLVSINRMYLEKSMAALGGAATDVLGKQPDFVATSRHVGGDGDMMVFINLRAVIESIRRNAVANPMFAMIWGLIEGKLLGNGLKNAAFTMSLEKDGIHSASFINDGGAKQGLLGILDGPGFPGRDPGTEIPADVESFSKTSLHVPRLWALLRDIVQMALSFSGNPGADPEQILELQFQIKIREVIDALGSELVVYNRPATGPAGVAPIPGLANVTVALELKNEEPIRNLINQLAILSGGALQGEKYLERDIFKFDPAAGDAGPALAIADKLLVFALTGGSAKEVIRRRGADSVNSIKDNPLYQKLVQSVPERVTMLEYYGPGAYAETLKVLEMVQSDIPLPNLDPLVNLLVGGVGWARWVDDGLIGKGHMRFKETK